MYGDRLSRVHADSSIALATIHLVFNLATSMFFLMLITPFTRLIDFVLGEGKMDFERLALPVFEADMDFAAVKAKLEGNLERLLYFLQENYNTVTLSIETNYQGIYNAAEMRIESIEFVKKDYLGYFSKIVSALHDQADSKALIRIINQFDYLFQIHDSIDDLFSARKVMSEHFIELRTDIVLLIRDLSSQTLNLFDEIHKAMLDRSALDIKQKSRVLQDHLDDANRQLLSLLADPIRRDAGALTNFVTYSQRLKDKLINFAENRLTS